MNVKKLKEILSKLPEEQEVVLLNEARLGHDDAILGFSIRNGFLSEDEDDLRLEKSDDNGTTLVPDDDDYEDGTDLTSEYNIPCCVISFWK